MDQLSQAPVFEVLSVHWPSNLKVAHYELFIQRVDCGHHLDPNEAAEPKNGDLFALSGVRPKSIGDLVRSNRPYTLAIITQSNEGAKGPKYSIEVKTSRTLENMDPKKEPLYAVFLDNLITNNRIWICLKMAENQIKSRSSVMNIVLYDGNSELNRCNCWHSTSAGSMGGGNLNRFNLNEAQDAAVLSCLSGRGCNHQPTAKLIWGPPGTGKTKTVTALLWSLLKQKCRTLSCAPTNVAVVQIASRLLKMLEEMRIPSGCSLGDVVLFGNEKKMKIKEIGLETIFLKHRVRQLDHCFARITGWGNQLQEMKALFEDCFSEYKCYLNSFNELNEEKPSHINPGKSWPKKSGKQKKEQWVEKDPDKDKEDRGKKVMIDIKQKHKGKQKWVMKSDKIEEEEAIKVEEGPSPMTFSQYAKKRYIAISHNLKQHIGIMLQHLPSKKLTPFVVKHLNTFVDFMGSIMAWLNSGFYAETQLTKVYSIPVQIEGSKAIQGNSTRFQLKTNQAQIMSYFKLEKCSDLSIQDICNGWGDRATSGVWKDRLEFLQFVSSLQEILKLPKVKSLEDFCLANSILTLCTACSSFRLRRVPECSAELLIVDEAAQLKECESLIPMQLPGLRHVVLIGDECQLPAMVMSEVCQRAYFGRSLFERLVSLGHEKHLLNVQYRMHPSISIFPNVKFYDNLILNGENVKLKSYERVYLSGRMYGPYSFINVHSGVERFDAKHSRKNMVEVEVVSILVEKLFQVYRKLKLRLTIGIISPYTAQVVAVEKKLGKRYEKLNGFNVKVKSVDGFQGGEEDIIIMSTVRSNMSGSVGFLSNLQRTNVALTRAKHCLWILGNENTLRNSGTIWKDVVLDASNRGCLFEAESDYDLVKAVGSRNVELDHFDDMFIEDSPFFSNAKWKVLFGDDFRKSLQNVNQTNVRCEIVELVKKLADGFRPSDKNRSKAASTSSLNLLKHCNVRGHGLFWTVELCKDSSDTNFTQALKFWDTLPMSEAPKLTEKLEVMFQKYNEEYISRCRFRCIDGDSEVPMCWPIGENALRPTTTTSDMFADQINLESHFASLKLVHEASAIEQDSIE